MRFGEYDDWSIENGGLHGTAHHSITKKGGDTISTIIGVWVTEILLKSLPIHRIVGLEKTEVREEPMPIVSFRLFQGDLNNGMGSGGHWPHLPFQFSELMWTFKCENGREIKLTLQAY